MDPVLWIKCNCMLHCVYKVLCTKNTDVDLWPVDVGSFAD